MTTALTPALALDYVRELSADIVGGRRARRAAASASPAPSTLAEPARALLAPPRRDASIHGTTEHGQVFAARDDTHAIVVVTGPFALPRVTRHDLLTALSALGGQTRPNAPNRAPPEAATRALLAAAQDPFRRPQSRLMVRIARRISANCGFFPARSANPVRTHC